MAAKKPQDAAEGYVVPDATPQNAVSMAVPQDAVPQDSDAEVQAYRSAQEVEWNTYVAREAIDFNGARAYNVGDPVPVSNVERHGYAALNLVEKRA